MPVRRFGLLLTVMFLCLSSVYADQLKVGSPAPDFWAPASDGSKVKLSEWLNRAPIVLFFYPKDDNSVSIPEVCDLRDNFSGFRDLKVSVFGVSYDSISSHQQFVRKYHLPFPLLSDLYHSIANSFGAGGLISPSQQTFIIDKHGTIVYINRDVNPATQSIELQNALAQL